MEEMTVGLGQERGEKDEGKAGRRAFGERHGSELKHSFWRGPGTPREQREL